MGCQKHIIRRSNGTSKKQVAPYPGVRLSDNATYGFKMNSHSIYLDCSFHSGTANDTYTGPYKEFKFNTSGQESTVITTYVLMTGGCYIDNGFATLDNNNVTLTYTSWDNGPICFEQYSCEICFTIPTSSLPSGLKYILNNDHEIKLPEDEFLSI